MHILASLALPKLNALVEGSAGQQAGIRGEADVVDELHVASEACQRLLVDARRPHVQREVV